MESKKQMKKFLVRVIYEGIFESENRETAEEEARGFFSIDDFSPESVEAYEEL